MGGPDAGRSSRSVRVGTCSAGAARRRAARRPRRLPPPRRGPRRWRADHGRRPRRRPTAAASTTGTLDDRPRELAAGAVLCMGASAVTVAGPPPSRRALEPGPAGGRRCARPRAMSRSLDRRSRSPSPARRRHPASPPGWVAVALPAVGGVLMAWLLHTPTVPVLRPAEPGRRPGHLAVRPLDRAAQRREGRRGARRRAPRGAGAPGRGGARRRSGPPRRRTPTWPR